MDDSSPQRVVNAVLSGIQKGRFVPGQRLIEVDLTRELKISRGPVREAFKRLAGEGVLVLNRHRGAYIRAHTREEVNDTLSVMETLGGLAAKLAAQSIHKGDNRQRLKETHDRMMAQGKQGETFAFLGERRRFYDTLYEIGGNRELQRMIPRMQISLLRLQFQAYVTPQHHENQLKGLKAIAEAVLAGDEKRAERACREHLKRRRRSMTSFPEEAYAAAQR
ncbi:MAG: GntR family transcriptional regulator [Gammaproteobacteria bacterium]|nr:GntR family transcriptional regulator [Gammaproteobacteria bacterium]